MVENRQCRKSLFIVSVLVSFLVCGTAHAQGNEKALRQALHQMKFTVTDGGVHFFPILEMCCQCQLPSCYGNNASSTYGVFALPPGPGQDPAVTNPYQEWYTTDGTLPPGQSAQWRLRPDEAVLFLGRTPPKVDYFGFTVYMYDRYLATMPPNMPPCVRADGTTRPQPNSSVQRYPIFASLADTVNPMTINLLEGRQDPYLKDVVFILTADKGTEGKIRSALMSAGYPEESFNLLPVSPDLARLGLESHDDSLSFLLRVASSESSAEIEAYYNEPKTLMRISPNTEIPPEKLDPVPVPKLRVRGTKKTESSLLPAVDALEDAIIARYPGYTAEKIIMAAFPEGYNCISNTQKCLADNRDTVFISPAFDPIHETLIQAGQTLGPDEFYVAYGVIHPDMDKATYSNISVMGWTRRAAPVMITNKEMKNSAAYFMGPGGDTDAVRKLYAYKIARSGGCDSETGYCKVLPTDCVSGVALDEDVVLVFRAYMEPKTKVGPAYGELILDRILKFTPSP